MVIAPEMGLCFYWIITIENRVDGWFVNTHLLFKTLLLFYF
jgi:hypothetical protein